MNSSSHFPPSINISDSIKNPLLQRITGGAMMVLGIILILLVVDKNINLVINGEVTEYKTYSFTVNSFLKEQGFTLQDNDRVNPPPRAFLWGGETIFLTLSQQIQIFVDDQSVTLTTAERIPNNILLEAGISIYPGDRLLINGTPSPWDDQIPFSSAHTFQILRGTPIKVQTAEGFVHFTSDANSLSEALYKEDIEILEGDHLSLPLSTALDGTPLSIELIRSKPYLVQISNRIIPIRTTANTVGTALAQTGLSLQGLDFSIPPETAPLPEDGQIEIVRVKEEIILNQEQIPFTTEYQPVNDLELDQLKIVSGGEFGIKAQRLRVIYENGTEISREVEKEWTIKEPNPRVIGYGTQITIRTANTPDGEIQYWRKITAWATSYNPTCEGCTTYTASGTDLKKGAVAVRLDWYRYMKFQRVYIPGYGFGRIEDVGGGVPWSANWVDLGYKEHDYVPWSQNVTVYFLAPAPPPENIMYVLY